MKIRTLDEIVNRIKELIDEIEKTNNYVDYDYSPSLLISLRLDLTEEEVRSLYVKKYNELYDDWTDEKDMCIGFQKIVFECNYNYTNYLIRLSFLKYKNLLVHLFSLDDCDSIAWLKINLIKAGCIPSKDIYNLLSDSKNTTLSQIGIQNCSFDKLIEHKNHKDHALRKMALSRLGPCHCLDDMLSDNRADIRSMGINKAPVGYEKLSELYDEPNLQNCNVLIKKTTNEGVVLMAGNKNIKSVSFSKLVKYRLEDM